MQGIRKIGPLFEIAGPIIIWPNRSYPLPDYKPHSEELLVRHFKHIEEVASDWWMKFPNCCDVHREMSENFAIDKRTFEYIPQQIADSVRYFVHCLEKYACETDGLKQILNYYEYLRFNLGTPGWGDHLLRSAVVGIISWAQFDDCEFSDEQKLELLYKIDPSEAEVQSIRESQGDLGELYRLFELWLDSVPSIGEFALLKQRLAGRVPMNLFLTNVESNRFLGIAKSQVKSTSQLIIDLENYSRALLATVHTAMDRRVDFAADSAFTLAEERLRIESLTLFSDQSIPGAQMVSQWLKNWTEYFQTINSSETISIVRESNIQLSSYFRQELAKYDILNASIADLRGAINGALAGRDPSALSAAEEAAESIVNSQEFGHLSDHELAVLNDRIAHKIASLSQAIGKATSDKMKAAGLPIKHKLKLRLPLFLCLRYEAEADLGSTIITPRTMNSLRKIIF